MSQQTHYLCMYWDWSVIVKCATFCLKTFPCIHIYGGKRSKILVHLFSRGSFINRFVWQSIIWKACWNYILTQLFSLPLSHKFWVWVWFSVMFGKDVTFAAKTIDSHRKQFDLHHIFHQFWSLFKNSTKTNLFNKLDNNNNIYLTRDEHCFPFWSSEEKLDSQLSDTSNLLCASSWSYSLAFSIQSLI